MERFKQQAVLLALLDAMKTHGSWCGETHVQKCVYFLKEGLGVPLDVRFVLYKHGPFSFDLREVLGEMRGNFLIDVESRRPYGPSLVVAESGGRLLERFPKTVAEYESRLEFVASELSTLKVVDLERLGTALYVLKEHPEESEECQADRLVELKPHIPPAEALAAVRRVDELLAEAQRLACTA